MFALRRCSSNPRTNYYHTPSPARLFTPAAPLRCPTSGSATFASAANAVAALATLKTSSPHTARRYFGGTPNLIFSLAANFAYEETAASGAELVAGTKCGCRTPRCKPECSMVADHSPTPALPTGRNSNSTLQNTCNDHQKISNCCFNHVLAPNQFCCRLHPC